MKKSKTVFLLFFLVLLAAGSIHAAVVEKISIKGNTVTKEYIIRNEIGFREKENIKKSDIKEALRRLRNMDIFSDVRLRVKKVKKKLRVSIHVTERWTTIPILKLSSGGGTQLITVGVYDPNIAGHYIEAGAQYQKLGDTNSGVFWFKNPRLFGSRHGFELQGWKTNRLRTKFDQGADSPVITNGFLQTRDKIFAAYRHEFSNDFAARLTYEFNQDRFSDRLVPDEVKPLLSAKGLPQDSEFHFAGLDFTYGQVNINSYLLDGTQFNFNVRHGFSKTPGLSDFDEANFSFRYYKTLFKNHTFAQRLLAGGSSTGVLQYWYYLGGLDRIRGFADNRFAGRYYWLSNTEYRYPVWKSESFVLQTVSFVDLVNVSESFGGLASLSGASAGVGLRVFLPKVYRFTLRIDYAQPLRKDDENKLNFGVQQFF